jgi:FKBP-type peptidyl-prolyl cis-trans isomerase 2
MQLKKNDFIEIEFVGKTSEGEIFDTNKKSSEFNEEKNASFKPFLFSLGNKMFLEAIDEFLIGKEIGKDYFIELNPKQAFGERNSKAVQIIPKKVFQENKLNPVQGAIFNFDGRTAKVLSSNGGRILVDFNHPLAGKKVSYEIKVLRKVEDKKEQVKAFNDFLFRKEFDFEIKEKKLILKIPKEMEKFIQLFKDKYLEVLGLDLETKIQELSEKNKELKKEDKKE